MHLPRCGGLVYRQTMVNCARTMADIYRLDNDFRINCEKTFRKSNRITVRFTVQYCSNGLCLPMRRSTLCVRVGKFHDIQHFSRIVTGLNKRANPSIWRMTTSTVTGRCKLEQIITKLTRIVSQKFNTLVASIPPPLTFLCWNRFMQTVCNCSFKCQAELSTAVLFHCVTRTSLYFSEAEPWISI